MARQGIMLCYPFEERRLQKWGGEAYIQYKLNGERCRALCLGNKVELYSSEANLIPFLPHINDALRKLSFIGIELDGELYTHGFSLQYIHSVVSRKVNQHEISEVIEYHIFDVVSSVPQIDRFKELHEIALRIQQEGLGEILRVVLPSLVTDMNGVNSYLEQAIDEGYEGIILRNPQAVYERKRSTNIMKFKPHQEDVYEIIGTQEEISIHGTPKNALGAFVCRGDDGETFNVGSGPSRAEREAYWRIRESLVGQYLKVRYQTLSPGRRVPCHAVAVQVLDLKAKA